LEFPATAQWTLVVKIKRQVWCRAPLLVVAPMVHWRHEDGAARDDGVGWLPASFWYLCSMKVASGIGCNVELLIVTV
jgi:hypothetical protein